MRTRFRLGAWMACLTTLACVEPVATLDYPITPSAMEVWSGGSVNLHSRMFTGADSLPRVWAGARLLSAGVLDTFLIRVELPDTTGWMDLQVEFPGGRRVPVPPVRAHGFVRWFQGAAFGGHPVQGPAGPYLFGFTDSSMVLFDARTGRLREQYSVGDRGAGCTRAPPITLLPGAGVRIRPSTCVYLVEQGGTVVDSFLGGQGNLAVIHTGPGRWLVSSAHRTAWYDAGVRSSEELIEDLNDLIMSPAHNRLFPEDGWVAAGVPVLDGGGVAYRLGGQYVEGLDFSADGDTAFAVLWHADSTPNNFLQVLDPVTGSVWRTHGIWEGTTHLRVDPGRPWMYAVGWDYVLVIDRRSLEAVARLRLPRPVFTYSPYDRLLLDAVARRLYIVQMGITGPFPSQVYVLDLLP